MHTKQETVYVQLSQRKPDLKQLMIKDNEFYWRDIHKGLHKGKIAELFFVA